MLKLTFIIFDVTRVFTAYGRLTLVHVGPNKVLANVQGGFFSLVPPKKLKYGKPSPRLGESTLT